MKYIYNILVTLSTILFATSLLYAQPKLEIKEGKEFQLGEVKEGVILKKQLTLSNIGSDILSIDDIRTSCGCTIAKTAKKKLASGESTILSIDIDTKDSKGLLKKQVFVSTNETKDKEYEIVMYMTVRNVIEFKPMFINFHTMTVGNTYYDTATVFNTSEKAFTITSLNSPETQISLKLNKQTIPPHDSCKLVAIVTPNRRGPILGQFELKTTIPEKKSVKLSFIGKIR